MSVDMHTTRDCFIVVHDNLKSIPDEFCFWKKDSVDGRKISKSLQSDYRPLFKFIQDNELKNNLAELRMCIDYHRSIYEFLKPGLTFGWQHKLVLCQLAASIYEGILLDLAQYKTNLEDQNTVSKVITHEKFNSKSVGLGYLVDLFCKAGFIKNVAWKGYLEDIKHLRNTVHPKSLNSEHVSYEKNKVIKGSVDDLVWKLDKFISLVEKEY